MATKSEIADVLERAADMYESEQVEWCRGSWGGKQQDGGMTACASSALGLAAGITHAQVRDLEMIVATGLVWGNNGLGTKWERLYLATRRHVDHALGSVLPAWNDQQTTQYSVDHTHKDYPLLTFKNVPSRSKEQVVQLFKELAKDLRNEE